MPSRKVSTTTTKAKKNTMVKQQATKSKPEVTVTEDSSPEEILHSSWLFINAFQFFHTFRAYFRLPAFDIERLENGLLQQEQKEDDHFIEQFFIQVLSPFLGPEQRKKLSINNFESYLFKLFPEFEGNSFFKLHIMDKIRLLKAIEDQTIDSPSEQFNSWRLETSPDDLRIQPLGTDSDGWTYWYFGDFRLYREVPFSKGKQGKNFLIANDFTFDLVCSNEESWKDIMKKLKPSKRATGLDLATKIHEIGATVLNRLEAREQTRLRNEAKLKKAKEMELIPKKRSRRLEAKFDEEVKRQKIEETQRQQEALEEYERKKKKEEEEEHMRTIVEDLKEQVRQYIEIEMTKNPDNMQLQELQSQLSKQARESVRVRRMQGWIALFKDNNKNKNIRFNKEKFAITSKTNNGEHDNNVDNGNNVDNVDNGEHGNNADNGVNGFNGDKNDTIDNDDTVDVSEHGHNGDIIDVSEHGHNGDIIDNSEHGHNGDIVDNSEHGHNGGIIDNSEHGHNGGIVDNSEHDHNGDSSGNGDTVDNDGHGDNENESENDIPLTEPLLKNTLRVLLMTLNNRLENDHPMNKVYKNLILDKYENLQQFSEALNQATAHDLPLRDHVSRLLHTIFNEPFYKQAL